MLTPYDDQSLFQAHDGALKGSIETQAADMELCLSFLDSLTPE